MRLFYHFIVLVLALPCQVTHSMHKDPLNVAFDDLTNHLNDMAAKLGGNSGPKIKSGDGGSSKKSGGIKHPSGVPIGRAQRSEGTFDAHRDFFLDVMGLPEDTFRTSINFENDLVNHLPKLKKLMNEERDQWIGIYPMRQAIFEGICKFYTLNDLEQENAEIFKELPLKDKGLLQKKSRLRLLVAPTLGNDITTNILYLQAQPENKDSLNQDASTFYGPLEGGEINADMELEEMAKHAVQGENAAIGAAPATIYTKYFEPLRRSAQKKPWPFISLDTKGRDGVKKEDPRPRDYASNYWYLLQDFNDTNGKSLAKISWQKGKKPKIPARMITGYNYTPGDEKKVGVLIKQNIVVSCGIDRNGNSMRLPIYLKESGKVDRDNTQIISQVLTSAANLGGTITTERMKVLYGDPGANTKYYKNNSLLQGYSSSIHSFCRTLLNGAYRGTIEAAYNIEKPRVFLTLVGGGAFRNPINWIAAAIEECVPLIYKYGLDVTIVYRPDKERMINSKSEQLRNETTDLEFLTRMVVCIDQINNTKLSQSGSLIKNLKKYLHAAYVTKNANDLKDAAEVINSNLNEST